MKKYLFLALAAVLFAACGSDDDETPINKGNGGDNGNEQEQPALIDFADYSNVIDMSYSAMIRQYPNPTMNFGDFYIYEPNDGKVSGLTIAVNPTSQTVYMIVEQLAENAFKEADIVDYFNSKYHSYGSEKQNVYDDNENVIGQTTVYSYGNAEKQDDATLVIALTGNESVVYTNPQNIPETPEGPSLDEITPIEAATAFLLHDVEDIEDEYSGVFTQMNGMYMSFMEENPWIAGIAFTPEDGFVTSLIILYNEELSDDDIMAYYTEAGYTCTKTGQDEDGEDVYVITNGVISIDYSAQRGVVTVIDD